jgi:hypothetical protein
LRPAALLQVVLQLQGVLSPECRWHHVLHLMAQPLPLLHCFQRPLPLGACF